MKPIDLSAWPRRAVFDHYSRLDHPFFSVTFRLDVTPLYRYTKAHGLSFYHAFVYLCARAVNEIEDFHYTVREGAVCRLERRIPAWTDMPPGSDVFHVVALEIGDSMARFCAAAKTKNETQTAFMDESIPEDTLLRCSCLPWVDMTGLSSARDLDRDNGAPYITWGKFVEEDGRKMLGVCLEVNHRFQDGFHVGLLHRTLTRLMGELE